ncbi:hypothetical protein ACFQBQ_11385 [Granulicella cerasi]|uniref:Uncharacterized protein n=1 Tax=Granulicella cerasi TaxID=741063 RepID=A0ABW1ZAV9_9BACT|nr:hypothetical protein [Granulicella cerasi]
MRLMVGGVDRTESVTGVITVQRVLGERARMTAELLLGAMPARAARVVATTDAGVELFSGLLVAEPVKVYAGAASEGPVYRVRLTAMGEVQASRGVTHAFGDGDAVVSLKEVSADGLRELASDVALSGQHEPAAYVTECFVGDGTTTAFALTGQAFQATKCAWLSDAFEGAVLDATRWVVSDPGAHLSLSGDGLTLKGGTGVDGVTTLAAKSAMELGGSIVAELSGVSFGAGSDGMLAGFYAGTAVLANCFAGWRVRPQAAQTVVVPLLNGAEVGTVFTPVAGHLYTLRVRLACNEMLRVKQRYSMVVDGAVETFGDASAMDAAMQVVFEMRDEGVSSSMPVTVLYDSVAAGVPVVDTPAMATFAAVNATSMFDAVRGVSVTQSGPMLVASVTPAGVSATRMIGSANDGVDCEASYGSSSTNASVTFFAGRVPEAGERVMVSYRRVQRAVARVADEARVAAEVASGADGFGMWQGRVTEPAARTSEDCETAAKAWLASAASRSAGVVGELACVNPASDVMPGDFVSLVSAGDAVQALVRSVDVVDGASVPETMRYAVAFANTLAAAVEGGMGMRVETNLASDAALPLIAEDRSALPQVLANLQQLAVTSLSETAIQIDAGVVAPSGGGFEVRRHDGAFGSGGTDLVLQSPVRGFAIPRVAQRERFFVRMYDASVPVKYSRWSAVVAVDAPVN